MVDRPSRLPGRETTLGDMVVSAEYDWSVTSPSVGIAETIADAVDRGVEDIEPLYEFVDPDALNSMLTDSDGDVQVSFACNELEVRVGGNGTIVIRRPRRPETL